ncbi:piercer of microtubule wall 2 protein [Anolis carolinensis]|uniref:piercer of microtubule wall 2 protein n=1 Tax=Anolis carolinensis TaxID=28377 RepID=UPI002F2B63A3
MYMQGLGMSSEETPASGSFLCANPGNPVASCGLDPKSLTTGGGPVLGKPHLLMYLKTSEDYGAVPPTSPLAPCRFWPRSNAFTDYQAACGRSQLNGINTGVERGRVIDHKELINVL